MESPQRQYHILMVGGIFGETISTRLTGSYMRALKPYFQKILPGSHITRLQPLFWQKKTAVIAKIKNIVMRSKAIHNQKVILVAHSKGCVDVIRFLLAHQELFQSDTIQGVVLLSPPFKGSIVADVLSGWLGKLTELTSLAEVKTDQAVFYEILQQASPEFKQNFKQKVIVVKSFETQNKRVPHPIKHIHWLVNRRQILNDGLVPYDSQTSPLPVRQEHVHPRHHGFLSCLPPISNISIFERYRFFKKVFQVFANPETATKLNFKERLQLKVGTYNVGLLPIPFLGVPFSKLRSKKMPEFLKKVNLDILCLQEMFGQKPRELLQNELAHYVIQQGPVRPHNGLVTLIRKDLVDECYPITSEYFTFSEQRATEPLVGFEKGYLVTEFKPRGFPQAIKILNVHLTAFGSAKKIRKKQLKQLFLENLSQGEVVLLCGDFNQEFDLDFAKRKSYRAISYINKIKPIWLQEPSQRIDYVFPVSMNEQHRLSVHPEEMLLREPMVELGFEKDKRIELSDHHLVSVNVHIDHHGESSDGENVHVP